MPETDQKTTPHSVARSILAFVGWLTRFDVTLSIGILIGFGLGWNARAIIQPDQKPQPAQVLDLNKLTREVLQHQGKLPNDDRL